jgi:hypothetical protein
MASNFGRDLLKQKKVAQIGISVLVLILSWHKRGGTDSSVTEARRGFTT